MIKHSITPETLSAQVNILNLLNYYFNVSKFKKVLCLQCLSFAEKLVAATKALLLASVILPSSRSDERAVKARACPTQKRPLRRSAERLAVSSPPKRKSVSF